MGGFGGKEICQLVGIYNCGLQRDDGQLILRNVNGQRIDQISKSIIKMFKNIGFINDTETNLKIVDFIDITSNLSNDTYRPYKKPNDLLTYINKSSNHPTKIINQLPKIINEHLSRNSSNKEVFNATKVHTAYTEIQLMFNKTATTKQKEINNVILFGFRLSTEQSLQTLDKSFSNYYVTTSRLPTSFKKYLIKTRIVEALLHPKCIQHYQIP